jgi:hypothetical protein
MQRSPKPVRANGPRKRAPGRSVSYRVHPTARLMDGFPPEPNGQVTLANWRTSPFNRWAFHHLRELLPTADIPNDPAQVMDLQSSPIDLWPLSIESMRGDSLSFGDVLRETGTDGLVILHRGRIVFEHYANGMTVETPHILMSVSKSILGELHRRDQVVNMLEAAVKSGAGGLIVFSDPLTYETRQQISDLTAKLRLPALYGHRAHVEAGGLVSYGADRRAMYRRAADYVDKILSRCSSGRIR